MKKIGLFILCLFNIISLTTPVYAESSNVLTEEGYELGTILYEFDEYGNLVENVVTDSNSITINDIHSNISLFDLTSYSVVQINDDGSEVELDLFEVLEEAQVSYDALCNENSNVNYAIKQGDEYIQIKYGIVVFKRIKSVNSSGKEYISTTNYTNANSRTSGYLHVDQGLDAAYLETTNGKVKFKIAGVTGLVNESLVDIVPYAKNSTNVDYYKVSDGNLIHYIRLNSVTSTGKYSSIHAGVAPESLKSNVNYYSFDGHYFYANYFEMIDDYRNGNYDHAVNEIPYYNYYQFLPMHSDTNYTGSDINKYINNKMPSSIRNKSVIYNKGEAFIQDNINVNPLMTLGVAINESYWGSDLVAQNNIFGLNAVDSNPSGSANKYVSVESCIEIFMQQHITHGYLDTRKDSRYLGGHLGDKESGINVRYASDPYWGEKAAAHCYSIDSYLGNKDYEKYALGMKESYDAINIHKEESKSSGVIYTMKNTYANHSIANMPVIILSESDNWYKIYTDHLLDENQNRIIRNGEPLSWLYEQYYNFDYSYGYVEKDKILKLNNAIEVNVPILSVALDKTNETLEVGNSTQLTATINPSDTTDDKSLTWSSSNTKVATVDANGLVTAVGVGTTTITVKTSNSKTATCTINVKSKSNPFVDVPKNEWYYSYVLEANALGIMTGTSTTTFSPNDEMSRGMVATVLYRLAGQPSGAYINVFNDVPNNWYYTTPIAWAAKNKIVTGYDEDGTFRPDNATKRQELATMLFRYANSIGMDTSQRASLKRFNDYGSHDGYAKDALEWCVAVGILSGDAVTGNLNPKDTATRSQGCKMLLNFYKLMNE